MSQKILQIKSPLKECAFSCVWMIENARGVDLDGT